MQTCFSLTCLLCTVSGLLIRRTFLTTYRRSKSKLPFDSGSISEITLKLSVKAYSANVNSHSSSQSQRGDGVQGTALPLWIMDPLSNSNKSSGCKCSHRLQTSLHWQAGIFWQELFHLLLTFTGYFWGAYFRHQHKNISSGTVEQCNMSNN